MASIGDLRAAPSVKEKSWPALASMGSANPAGNTFNLAGFFRRLRNKSLRQIVAMPKVAISRARDIFYTQPLPPPSEFAPFDQVLSRSLRRTDISDHLVTLFVEALEVKPQLIVELGVRGGESTYVLERVAEHFGSRLVSVDVEDCSKVSRYKHWSFVKSDDLVFADNFPAWCAEHGINSTIDVLFIDTSHELEHTRREIASWFPFLSDRSKVFFHDTNMRDVFIRRDGSTEFGYHNHRGVVAAIEESLGYKIDESRDFIASTKDWIIKHHACCCGFTILERIPSKTM
jgi:cephalosporin hydroxylase